MFGSHSLPSRTDYLLQLLNLILQPLHVALGLVVRRPRILPLGRHLRLYVCKTSRHIEFFVSWPCLIDRVNNLLRVGVLHPIPNGFVFSLELPSKCPSLLCKGSLVPRSCSLEQHAHDCR